MKKIYFLFLTLLSIASVQAQTVAATPEVLSVKEIVYDFGKIPQGKPVFHYFEIKNTGTQPLKLESVQASCGCTTPEWSQDDIAPGATSKIKVGYNSASEGPFDKFITVHYNGSSTKQINIKGDVWRAPLTSAPVNSSVTFLKQQIQK